MCEAIADLPGFPLHSFHADLARPLSRRETFEKSHCVLKQGRLIVKDAVLDDCFADDGQAVLGNLVGFPETHDLYIIVGE